MAEGTHISCLKLEEVFDYSHCTVRDGASCADRRRVLESSGNTYANSLVRNCGINKGQATCALLHGAIILRCECHELKVLDSTWQSHCTEEVPTNNWERGLAPTTLKQFHRVGSSVQVRPCSGCLESLRLGDVV